MRWFALTVALALWAALAMAAPAVADDQGPEAAKAPAVVMDEVVVTATRTEKKVDDAPAHVTVITREEMDKRNINTVDEALKYEAGLYLSRRKGMMDGIPKISMRGLDGDERTLIMFNGVPLNDGYASQVPWNQLNTDDVERIEVIRGPGSALYGGNAMGGVINVITKAPERLEAMARFGVGYLDDESQPNYFKHGLSVGDKLDKVHLRASLDVADSRGYATDLVSKGATTAGAGKANSGYGMQGKDGKPDWIVGDKGRNRAYRENVSALGQYDITDDSYIRLDLMDGHHQYAYGDPHTYLDDGTFRGQAQAHEGFKSATIRPRDFAGGRGKENQLLATATYGHDFGAVDVTAKAGYGERDKIYSSYSSRNWDNVAVDNDLDNQPGSLVHSLTKNYFLDVQADHAILDNHTLTYGASLRMDDFHQDEDWLERFLDWDTHHADKDLTKGQDRLYALFLQDEWRALDELTFYAGARLDYWECFDGESGIGAGKTEHDDMNDSAVSPKLASVWNPLEDTYVRGSVSRGFRPPNLYELFRTWISTTGTTYASNPKLKPETMWNYELGGDQYLLERRVKLSATYFHSDVEDMIDSKTLANGDREKQNIGEARIDGLEFGVEARPWDWGKLWANWTVLDTEIMSWEGNEPAEGNELPGVPLETINLGVEATWNMFTASLAGNYQGRIYTDELNDETEGVYTAYSKRWLWDAKLICKPLDWLELSASVSNLFDEDYYDYYVGQPRTYYFEVKVLYF